MRVFESRYMDMVSACMKAKSPFGVCLIREGTEVARKRGEAAEPEEVGCMAEVVDFDMEELGVLNIVTVGRTRFRILERHVEPDGLIRAQVQPLSEDEAEPIGTEHKDCAQLLANIIADLEAERSQNPETRGKPFPFAAPFSFDDAGWVANRLCEVLSVPLKAKQKLMELEDPSQRLEIVHTYLKQKKVI